jgi:hypothetical protein
LQHQVSKLGPNGFEMRPKFVQVSEDKIIGAASWLDPNGRRQERYQVLTIRDGKIADMQVCGSRRQAKRFANRTRA